MLRDREPLKTVLSGNRDAIEKLSMRDIFEIVLATQSGMTVEEFIVDVNKWLATAKHPPMEASLYRSGISADAGGSQLPAWRFSATCAATASRPTSQPAGPRVSFASTQRIYGIPPEQVAGTSQAFKYGYDKDQRPILTREPKLVLDNLYAGKIENFWLEYGRRPYAAFGNSCHTRIRLRSRTGTSRQQGRHLEPSDVRYGQEARLGYHQHEERLETILLIRVVLCLQADRSSLPRILSDEGGDTDDSDPVSLGGSGGREGGPRCVKHDLVILPKALEETQGSGLAISIWQSKSHYVGQGSVPVDGAEQPLLKRVDGENEISKCVRPVNQYRDTARRQTFPNAHRPWQGNRNVVAPFIIDKCDRLALKGTIIPVRDETVRYHCSAEKLDCGVL